LRTLHNDYRKERERKIIIKKNTSALTFSNAEQACEFENALGSIHGRIGQHRLEVSSWLHLRQVGNARLRGDKQKKREKVNIL
jgi:hypothetical protein